MPSHAMSSPARHRHALGFTLVELLAAIAVLAVLALMSWRGIDAMVRARAQTQSHNESHLVLQTALAQWNYDLDALMPLAHTQTLDWNGKALRLTRRSSEASEANRTPDTGALVVAWTQRAIDGQDHWLRWQSLPLTTLSQWREAWQQADQWARNPDTALRSREVALFPLAQWNVLFFRGGAWVHPQSSSASTPSSTPKDNAKEGRRDGRTALPQGVLLQLTRPEQGLLTYQWLNPSTSEATP